MAPAVQGLANPDWSPAFSSLALLWGQYSQNDLQIIKTHSIHFPEILTYLNSVHSYL